jgi:pimeloyl-ACP methyl ester carboxylesterase
MQRTVYQSADIDGLSVFYREAGPPDAPVILLLHGFPSSSRMWEPLLARLSDEFRLVAPDYPGFGHSDAPDPARFPYTFDHLADITARFTEALSLESYVLFTTPPQRAPATCPPSGRPSAWPAAACP